MLTYIQNVFIYTGPTISEPHSLPWCQSLHWDVDNKHVAGRDALLAAASGCFLFLRDRYIHANTCVLRLHGPLNPVPRLMRRPGRRGTRTGFEAPVIGLLQPSVHWEPCGATPPIPTVAPPLKWPPTSGHKCVVVPPPRNRGLLLLLLLDRPHLTANILFLLNPEDLICTSTSL